MLNMVLTSAILNDDGSLHTHQMFTLTMGPDTISYGIPNLIYEPSTLMTTMFQTVTWTQASITTP